MVANSRNPIDVKECLQDDLDRLNSITEQLGMIDHEQYHQDSDEESFMSDDSFLSEDDSFLEDEENRKRYETFCSILKKSDSLAIMKKNKKVSALRSLQKKARETKSLKERRKSLERSNSTERIESILLSLDSRPKITGRGNRVVQTRPFNSKNSSSSKSGNNRKTNDEIMEQLMSPKKEKTTHSSSSSSSGRRNSLKNDALMDRFLQRRGSTGTTQKALSKKGLGGYNSASSFSCMPKRVSSSALCA